VVNHALEKRVPQPEPVARETSDHLDVSGLLPKTQEDKPAGLPIGPDGAALLGDLAVVSIATSCSCCKTGSIPARSTWWAARPA